MVRLRGRARELADLAERPVKDYDPEADVAPGDDDQDSNESSGDEAAGTEHYVTVGKSKLRRTDPLLLGPKYQGTRVSREDLEAEDDDDDEDEDEDEEDEDDEDDDEEEDSDEEGSSHYEDTHEHFDDPDTADLEADQQGQSDHEIDSDEAFGESDEERFKDYSFQGSLKPRPKKSKHAKRPTAADFMGSEDEAEEVNEIDDDEEDDDQEGLSEDSEQEGFVHDEAEESDDGKSGDEDEEDEEDDEDEDEEEEDSEMADFINDDEEEDSDEDGSDDEDGDEGEEDQSDDDDDDEEDSDEDGPSAKSKRLKGSGLAASVKEMMGEQGVVKALLKTVDADVQKGRAVQRQRKGFDALLNIRIRLQKSIVAMNSFEHAEETSDQTAEPYEAAERSALQLWNALDDFRSSINKGKKRKHAETDDTLTSTLWERMELHEKLQTARRKQVLEKWSRDAKKTSITASSANKFTSNAEKPITAILSAEMEAPERLIKRTRTPRSCAPYQAAKKVNEDESIYDDADFYQLLLKELVDQRSGDGSGAGLQAATIRYAATKEAKAKRHVDTKASKGRKMRFVPIPKLQNFMAPEDRRGWEQGAIDRFFGTLFGQKMVLDEESSDEEMENAPVEDDGFRLFKSA